MKKIIYLALVLILAILMVIGLSVGFITIPFDEVIKTLIGQGSAEQHFILWTLRMPRILITFILGIALAVSGNVLQTVTKNDLADPGILGINAGAGLGVTIAYLYFDFNSYNIVYILPLLGFLGAMLTFGMTYMMSVDKSGILNVDKMVLIGIGSATAFSGAMIVFISSAGREDVQFIYKWLSGNIWGDRWSFVILSSIITLVMILIIYFKAKTLNVLGFDDITATSLGVDLKKERKILIVMSVILASVVVSIAGAISFVGLIIPHISKAIFGPKHEHHLLGSMLLGSIFLISADLIGRHIIPPHGLLPGIVVAIIGAPYFLYLIIKHQS